MKRGTGLFLLCLLSQLPLASTSSQGAEDAEPVRCLRVSRIDHTEVIDDRSIAFHLNNGDIYVNRLDRICRDLDRSRPFSYRASIGQICSVDSITILDNFGFGLSRGASCGLGMFTPIDEETLSMLKGEEEPAEVTMAPIEVDE